MSLAISTVWSAVSDFLRSYVISGVITLIIALLAVSFAVWIVRSRNDYLTRSALRAEMSMNSQVAKALLTYAQTQMTQETTVQPMPRFYSSAFQEYKRAGLLLNLKQKSIEELENLYLYMDSINEAGRRQEDLAFGPASAYPNAQNLRIHNLQFIIDTVHNVVVPYYDRMRDVAL